MINVSSQIHVNAPLEVVFAYYSDQDRLQEWIPGESVLEFTPLTPAPKRPGSRYRMAYRSFGITFHLIAELTKLEPNKLSEMKQIEGDYESFQYDMQFKRADSNITELTMTIKARLPWGILGRIGEWLTQSQAFHEATNTLQRFKKGAESYWQSQNEKIAL